jgi:N-acyl-L-homoserine lactone synthetase
MYRRTAQRFCHKTKNLKELNEYFMLHKKVFGGDLGRIDGNSGNPSVEIGDLDSRFNIYILYRDEKSRKIAGGARLMPANGPTL